MLWQAYPADAGRFPCRKRNVFRDLLIEFYLTPELHIFPGWSCAPLDPGTPG